MDMDTAFRSEEQFTQAEFFEWRRRRPTSDINHYELLSRHIVMTPPAGFPHAPIEVRIGAALLQHASRYRLGLVNGSSACFELPSGDTVEPDVSFISAGRLAAGPRPEMGKFYRIVPDLVVEIVSPTTARRDMKEKKLIYEKNGIPEYWIVHPGSRHVRILRLTGGKHSKPVHVVHGVVESSVLPGLEIPLASIFADLE